MLVTGIYSYIYINIFPTVTERQLFVRKVSLSDEMQEEKKKILHWKRNESKILHVLGWLNCHLIL